MAGWFVSIVGKATPMHASNWKLAAHSKVRRECLLCAINRDWFFLSFTICMAVVKSAKIYPNFIRQLTQLYSENLKRTRDWKKDKCAWLQLTRIQECGAVSAWITGKLTCSSNTSKRYLFLFMLTQYFRPIISKLKLLKLYVTLLFNYFYFVFHTKACMLPLRKKKQKKTGILISSDQN